MGLKKNQSQHGFTIIELTLFFAISGLLLVSMLTGIGLAVQNQRFTDTVNGTQNFLQQQYNETQITINDRTGGPCLGEKGTSDCLVIGKIIDLGDPADTTSQETTINTYSVVIDQQAADGAMNADTPPTDLELLNDPAGTFSSNTRAVKDINNDQRYIIPWGAKLGTTQDSGGNPIPSSVSSVRYILVIRSPINALISTYKLNDNTDLFPGSSTENTIGGKIEEFSSGTTQSIKSCIKSVDLIATKALLKITPGSTQDSITTQFDTSEKSQWCP